MAIEYLAGPTDVRAAEYRDIAEPELVKSRGLFVAEGRLVVRRLIEDRRYTLRSLLVNRATLASLAPIVASLPHDLPIYACETADLLGITGYNIHRGCLALVERPPSLTPDEAIERLVASKPLGATVIVLEGVTNADNVGGVFRNAAAFDAGAVLLSPTCCDPLYRKAIRTSMAATLRVPFARVDEWPAGLEALKSSGFTIVALTPNPSAESIVRFAVTRPARVALLVGTEGAGLTERAESLADRRVCIPIDDGVDSLNLAVAAGIALHRLKRPDP